MTCMGKVILPLRCRGFQVVYLREKYAAFRRAALLAGIIILCGATPCQALTDAGDLSGETLKAYADAGFHLARQPEYPGVQKHIFSYLFHNTYFFCPLIVYYPQQMGNAVADSAVAAQARLWFDSAQTTLRYQDKESRELASLVTACLDGSLEKSEEPGMNGGSSDVCRDKKMLLSFQGQKWFSLTTYTLSRPSRDYVSLAFTTHMFGGGAQENWSYFCVTYDLRTGAEVTLEQLLPSDAAQQKLAALLVKKVQKAQEEAEQEGVSVFVEETDVSMSRIALNEVGLVVRYAPYELGGEEKIELAVSKRELEELGAVRNFWR